jgi:cobalt-zinc-cadmium efflux system outer membrane protein
VTTRAGSSLARRIACLAVLGVCVGRPVAGLAQPSPALPAILTLDGSVRFALENNPQLTALRQQRGIAAAGVVIARTYPFNPVYQGSVMYAQNNIPGQVFNPVPNSHQVTLEVQLFHQQRYRKEGALATLSRTEWEIAGQELAFSIQAIRAFDGLLYRQGKLAVNEEFLQLNQKAADQVKQLVEAGTLKSGDLLLARSEVLDIQSQIGLNRTALIAARRDFYRALGITVGVTEIHGTLERASPIGTAEGWLAAAFELRPERFARQAAITEADADVRFQTADRFGNPQIGPAYELNESRTSFVGAKVQIPIPILNRRPGEIQQANERRALALAQSRQTDVEIQQDVALATDRLVEARQWVENYRRTVLPGLRKSLEEMEQLFRTGQGGVDLLRVLEVRRKLLKAQDGYLDALWTYTQALADLAQAVGDPGLATGGCPPPK